MPSSAPRPAQASQKLRNTISTAFILALACVLAPAAEPPADLIKRVAQKETENEYYRAQYTYRQTVVMEEVSTHGMVEGAYREVRDVLFSPDGQRTEQVQGQPTKTLKRLQLTPEDFHDIRDIQPLLLTRERLWLYDVKTKGEEEIDGLNCYVLQVKPKQIISGQRLFEGLLWVNPADFAIVRSEGQAVPEIRTAKSENLFPHFTTIRYKVDGEHWFPLKTFADDTLFFRGGPQRIRMTIRYQDYKKFGSQSTIIFPAQP